MQQGCVLTDDDFNEPSGSTPRTRASPAPTSSARRIARLRVRRVAPASTLPATRRFRSARTFYLGGLRLENPSAEWFELQKDWLPSRKRPTDSGGRANTTRTDCVWMKRGPKRVAVEDSELFEKALGGPIRRSACGRCGACTESGVGGAPRRRRTALPAKWQAAGEGTPSGSELTDATLTVSIRSARRTSVHRPSPAVTRRGEPGSARS